MAKPRPPAAFEKYLGDLRAKIGDGGRAWRFWLKKRIRPRANEFAANWRKCSRVCAGAFTIRLRSEAQNFATQISFGDNLRLVPRIERADVILALDSDFLDCGEGDIASSRAFTSRRRVSAAKDSMNRLYVVENRFTLTGAMADHRLRFPASQIPADRARYCNQDRDRDKGRRPGFDPRHLAGSRGGGAVRRTLVRRSGKRFGFEIGRGPGLGRAATAGRCSVAGLWNQFRAEKCREHGFAARASPQSARQQHSPTRGRHRRPAGLNSFSFSAANPVFNAPRSLALRFDQQDLGRLARASKKSARCRPARLLRRRDFRA